LLSDAVDTIIETPIAAGETSIIATTPWSEYPELTGGEPVLLLSKTRVARDEAYEMSRQSDHVNAAKVTALSRCPIVRGEYDNHEPLNNLASGQEPISEWIKRECYEKWVPLSIVHQKLEEQYKSQTGDVLPCCREGGCPSKTPSNSRSLSQIREEETQYDVIHATQAYIQRSCSIRGLNVVFDRRPSFSIGSQERTLNEVVENYLSEIDSPPMYEFLEQSITEVRQRYQPDGMNIGLNDGPIAGQTIPHLHWHIIPRYDGDISDPSGGVRGVIPEKRIYK
jgi:hypothetical protein